MKKYVKDCYIILKGGILKSYYFSEDFLKNNKNLFEQLENIWDELYKNDCCVYGATESNKNNDALKIKLCDILDQFYDLNIEISNGWDNKIYKNKNDYRNYILNYGKDC